MKKLLIPATLIAMVSGIAITASATERHGFQRKSFQVNVTSPSFEAADRDRDGYLTKEEFEAAMEEIAAELEPFKAKSPDIEEIAPPASQAPKPAPEAEPTPFKRKVPETDITKPE